jgi:hypothetical protein
MQEGKTRLCSSLKTLAHLRTAPAAICLSCCGALPAVLGGVVDVGVGDGVDGADESRSRWQEHRKAACGVDCAGSGHGFGT